MRVLFLTNIPSPYRVEFFNELGKYCDLTVLYERKSASDRDDRWVSEKENNYKAIYLKGKNIRNDASISMEVLKYLNINKFDIFVIGGYSTPTGMLAIQILKMKKIPFILNSDGGFIKQDKKLVYKIKKYFISSANWWLSTGKLTNKYLEHYGAKRENIFIYPFTSIKESEIIKKTLTKEQKLQLRKELELDGENIILSVGQFIYRKGYDLLIEEWSNIDEKYKLLLIGSGNDKEKLINIIEEKKIKNIEILDFKTKSELRKYYLAADLFILPTREDIWGLVVNEAMACGLPVITTDKCIAGIELVSNGKNGYIIRLDEMNNIQKYIDKIEKLDFKCESIDIIKRYTIENMSKKHMKIFQNVLER